MVFKVKDGNGEDDKVVRRTRTRRSVFVEGIFGNSGAEGDGIRMLVVTGLGEILGRRYVELTKVGSLNELNYGVGHRES